MIICAFHDTSQMVTVIDAAAKQLEGLAIHLATQKKLDEEGKKAYMSQAEKLYKVRPKAEPRLSSTTIPCACTIGVSLKCSIRPLKGISDE